MEKKWSEIKHKINKRTVKYDTSRAILIYWIFIVEQK